MKRKNIYYLSVKTCILALLLGMVFTAFGQTVEKTKEANSLADTLTNVSLKPEVSTTINSIKGSDIIKNSAFSVGNALYGVIPGLLVRQGSGEPGSDQPTFRIRGNGTFGNSNDPYVLVDGFQRDLNSLSIDDIESISILKDATSAILYGGKAANGVIMVKTKRGSLGKSKISVNLLRGIQRPMALPQFVSSADYATMYNQARANDGLAPTYSAVDIANYRTGDPVLYPNVDWMKELVRKSAPVSRVNINARGGNDIVQYYTSVGYLINEGIYNHTGMNDGYSTNENLNNLQFRSNLDVKITRDWKVTFDIAGQINTLNTPAAVTSSIWSALTKYSSMTPVYAQGSLLGGSSNYPANPMGLINEQGYNTTRDRMLLTTLSTEYDFGKVIKGLVAGARYSYDSYYTVTDGWAKTFQSYSITKDPVSGNPVLSAPYGKNTNLAYNGTSGESQFVRFNLEGYLNYNVSLGSSAKLSANLLYHQDKLTSLPTSPFYNQSIGGLLNYSLKDRYIVELGASYNGVEAFAKDKRFALFPAVAVGWVVSNESFLKDNRIVNFLKVRGSAGVNGRSDFDNSERFAYRDFYTYAGTYYFGTVASASEGLKENALSNPNLAYEKSNKYDIGFESQLFGAVNFSAAWFYQKRTGILISKSNLVPSFVGVSYQDVNAGEAESKGIELSMNIDKSYKDWGYYIGLNYMMMSNKVLYNAELPVPAGSEYNYRSGQPISQPYGLEFVGFFKDQNDINASPVQQFGAVKPGDMKYRDKNGDGIVNQYDEGPISKTILPSSEIGLTLGANYKGFDVHAVFQAQLGRAIGLLDNPNIFVPLINDTKISTYVRDQNPRTVGNQSIANYPRLTTLANSNNYRSSDFWYKDGDFLRLRSAEVGYNLPSSLISRLKIEKFRLFLRGTNLFTLSGFNYSDPETYWGGYPAMQTYNLGLNVQF